jgi:XTP/dITP diphosphohydrolase
MKNIVFATNNKNKLREIRDIVGSKYNILSLSDINCHEDIPETADTIEGNALLKARFVKEKYGYDCFADDTGLEVEALDNRPGVYSARFAGEDCNSENNINKLLSELEGIENRKARFRTVIALIKGENEEEFEGVIYGNISHERHGEGGFGYDKVFVPENYEKTFAEMLPEEKNSISHRAKATRLLIEYLNKEK